MAEIKRWSGNATSQISLKNDELAWLMDFCRQYDEVYIYGNGKIGKAINHYLKQSGHIVSGNITTAIFQDWKKEYIPHKVGIIMGVSDQYYQEIMSLLELDVLGEDIFHLSSNIREVMGKTFSIDEIKNNFWLNVYVTNQCNLNCRSCSAFAPICNSPYYYDTESFRKDIRKIEELKLQRIAVIKFTGAEALLHPGIFDMFEVAREVFPDIDFECYTNGLSLFGLSEERLRMLRDWNIALVITEYPVEGLDLSKVYEKLDCHNVKYQVIYSEGQKYFSKRPLNFLKDTPRYLFFDCPRYKMCDSLFLHEGRLYKCIYALSADFVNEAFDKELKIQEQDFLDINNIVAEDVYAYCINRIPFCGYCSPIEELIPWGLSEKTIDEWS